MLFWLLKNYARIGMQIYCRKIVVNKPEYLDAQGPLLLAANHPNSFLDGMIMTTLFRHPMYSLARGDAFQRPLHNKLLRWLQLLPVYRNSEGAENLGQNYTTFASCQQVFAKNGIVMIFSEGRCINEWKLRPLRKGTARLAVSSWEKGIDLTVVPVAFNYSPFRVFGKNVFIEFGEPLNKEAILRESGGRQLLEFNDQLRNQLETLVYDIDPNDRTAIKNRLTVPQPLLKKILLFIPALAGALVNAPVYYHAKKFTDRHFNNDHYDSVVVAMLALSYPIYVSLLTIAAGIAWGWKVAVLVLVLLPFTAWCCVQLKPQIPLFPTTQK